LLASATAVPPLFASHLKRWASLRFKMHLASKTILAMRSTCALLLLAATSARADAIEFGVAVRCEKTNSTFELAAVVQHNEQISLAASRLAGITQLKYGEHKLQCQVGGKLVLASVGVSPPMNGECMGAGFVALKSLTVAGRNVGPSIEGSQGKPFNWKCTGTEPMIVRLLIFQSKTGITIEQCTAQDWSWERGYTLISCERSAVE